MSKLPLKIAVTTSALFDMRESDRIFTEKGVLSYRAYQKERENEPLKKGSLFTFIKKMSDLNKISDQLVVDFCLISRNDPITAKRVMHTLMQEKLEFNSSAFLRGGDPIKYLPAYNIDLYLSTNSKDVIAANKIGITSGVVYQSNKVFLKDKTLRLAFDFDGVIASDDDERIFKEQGFIKYIEYGIKHKNEPLNMGPMFIFYKKIMEIQALEIAYKKKHSQHNITIRTAIVTARGIKSHYRFNATLEHWGLLPDEVFMTSGASKNAILKLYEPHLFVDDQLKHVQSAKELTGAVHLPVGVSNEDKKALAEIDKGLISLVKNNRALMMP